MERNHLAYIKNQLANHIPEPEGSFLESAVMTLLLEDKDRFLVLFTRRSLTLQAQPGDVCFPGGKKEGRETPLQTAIREIEEEIGLPPQKIKVLGRADFILTNSGKKVTPIIGTAPVSVLKELCINPDEVDSVFTVPLSYFMETEPEIQYIHYHADIPETFPFERINGGVNYPFDPIQHKILFYEYENRIIWGLTARIIYNVCAILKGQK